MNIVKHYTYRLEFNSWEPFDKDLQNELDELATRLKCRHLLAHAGQIRLVKLSEEIVCQEKPRD